MDRDVVLGHLAATRYLLEAAETRLAHLTAGVDHPRVDTARDRLRAAGMAVGYAAGGLSDWTQTWLAVAPMGICCWVAATLTGGLLGFPAGATIAVTVTAAAVTAGIPVNKLNKAVARRLNRRRLSRPDPLPQIPSPPADPAAEVLGLLRMARDPLALATTQRIGAVRNGSLADTVAGFDWLRRRDLRLYWMSVADRCLCQVMYSTEIWLSTRAEQR